MAWRKRPETLEQFRLLGYTLQILCKGCGRRVAADAAALARHLERRGWPTDRIRGGKP